LVRPQSAPLVIYRYRALPATLRRFVDCSLGAACLLVFAPLLVAASIAVLLEDGWPVFFKQSRVGRFERSFTIYKLRTVYKHKCEDRAKPQDAEDPRVTRVGRWLRRFSIDEIPQFLNVLRGDMSLVGPRPEMPHIVQRYLPWQHLRHLVQPGITCFWQSEGRGRYPLESPEATQMDILYIEKAGVVTDVRILAQTLPSVLSARGSA
jgi:lipopolysaccharide/colanic/teichoic acid biosynthesis glycosyltransferase